MGTREPIFGLNNFGKAKVLNDSESLAQEIAIVLLNRPGYFPSCPTLGMGIQDILFEFYEDVTEQSLLQELKAQCDYFSSYISNGTFTIQRAYTNRGERILKVVIPVYLDELNYRLNFQFRNTPDGEVVFDYYYGQGDDSEEYHNYKF